MAELPEPTASGDQPARDHNERNRESQHRFRLNTRAQRLAESFPRVNIVVLTYSSEQLAVRSTICGPELGALPVAQSIQNSIGRLVRDLKASRSETQHRLDFTKEGA